VVQLIPISIDTDVVDSSLPQAVLAVIPILIVYSPPSTELIGGIAVAGTFLIHSVGLGHLISIRFPKAVQRDLASVERLSLSWIPLVMFIVTSISLLTAAQVGKLFGSWGVSLSAVIVLALSCGAYYRALPFITRKFRDNRQRLLNM